MPEGPDVLIRTDSPFKRKFGAPIKVEYWSGVKWIKEECDGFEEFCELVDCYYFLNSQLT